MTTERRVKPLTAVQRYDKARNAIHRAREVMAVFDQEQMEQWDAHRNPFESFAWWVSPRVAARRRHAYRIWLAAEQELLDATAAMRPPKNKRKEMIKKRVELIL